MGKHKIEEAVEQILNNGVYDGAHHKHEVLDAVLKILVGPVEYDRLIKEELWFDEG